MPLVMLMLFAFMVQSLIPVGFMPEKKSDGSATIVICTKFGPQEIHVSAENNPFHKADHQNDQNDQNNSKTFCAFAPVIAHAGHAIAPVLVLPSLRSAAFISPRATNRTGRENDHNYYAQGPPSSPHA